VPHSSSSKEHLPLRYITIGWDLNSPKSLKERTGIRKSFPIPFVSVKLCSGETVELGWLSLLFSLLSYLAVRL